MKKKKKKNRPLVMQVQDRLESKLAIGEKKHEDKAVYARDEDKNLIRDDEGKPVLLKKDETKDKIYSWNTFRTYLKHCDYFAKWCMEEYGCKSLNTCRKHCNEYLQKLIDEGKSPYTIKMTVSALVKLYGCNRSEFIDTPSRERRNITRSRGEAERDKHFSEKNNAELVNFCRCTGLRRAELEHLVGTDLVYEDGKPEIYVQRASKGGRKRHVEIVGTEEEIQAVVDRMNQAGEGLVWDKVSKNADIHGYRSDYCNRIYWKYAKAITDLPRSEIYYCQGELAGARYDKNAMRIASKNLGHNRINIIASNYLRATSSKDFQVQNF